MARPLEVGMLLKSKRTGKTVMIVKKTDNGFGVEFTWDVLLSNGRIISLYSRSIFRKYTEVTI